MIYLIKVIDRNSYGVVTYAATDIGDIDLLPRKGLSSTSTCQLITASGLRVFMFTQDDPEQDGMWVEI